MLAAVDRAIRAVGEPSFIAASTLECALREYLRRTPPAQQSVDGMAAHLGCSAGHLSRRCRRELGSSPHQFSLEMRLERARAMLEATPWPIADVAAETGFSTKATRPTR